MSSEQATIMAVSWAVSALFALSISLVFPGLFCNKPTPRPLQQIGIEERVLGWVVGEWITRVIGAQRMGRLIVRG